MAALEPVFLEAPAQISGQELRSAHWAASQEGAWASGDLKVTAGGGTREVSVAAGVVYVQGDAVTDQGLYRARNDAAVSSNTSTTGSFEAGGIPPADPTNPRIDQIVWRVYDTTHDGSGQRKARPEVIAGVAAAGATLDNRTGAVALPGGAVRLADVLVPAGATTISGGNIRDRRPWARGAYNRGKRTIGNASIVATAMTDTYDTADLRKRIECSGVPLRMSLRGRIELSAPGTIAFRPFVDGLGAEAGMGDVIVIEPSATGEETGFDIGWDFDPVAGSHVLQWGIRVSTGTATLFATAGSPTIFVVEEIARQNASND